MSDICPDCMCPKDAGKGWHMCAEDGGKGVRIDRLRAELDEARAQNQELSAMLGQGPYVPLHQHEELRRQFELSRAEVALLRRVNHRHLCGCEESAGVFGCGLECPCACHPLRLRLRLLQEHVKLRDREDFHRCAEVQTLRGALEAAAKSLESIWAGRAENSPEDDSDARWQVRSYAKSRADVARAALASSEAPATSTHRPDMSKETGNVDTSSEEES